ncbi:MAG: alpha-mannosidase [Anaerolineae bacterium]
MAEEKAVQSPVPVVHMIGNAHIDPVWLWRRDEGIDEVLRTARTAVELMDEYPDLTFSFAQAQSYVWIEERAPEVFARIRELVAAGRWHVVGGMWVQPDCNIPSGEALVRHLLYSQRYFMSRFGRRATVGYNVDSFGHAGTLPQLLAKGGLDCYVYFRPDPVHEVAMDEDLYWWEAPDGSRVLAYRPPNHYCTWAGEIEAWTVNSVVHAPERVGAVLCFFGVGDHGGGPTRENIESILRLTAREDMPPMRFGSLADFFAGARTVRQDYAVRRNDLQHHAPGCYSVHSGIKRWNRKAEQYLVAAEKANAALAMLGRDPLAGSMAFEETWRPVLFNQFHDILAGSSIAEAYDDSREDFAEVRRMCDGISAVALERLAAHTDCRGEGRPVLLFNPESRPRRACVELDADEGIIVTLDGEPLPTQRTCDGRLLAAVPLPAVGAACIHLVAGEAATTTGPVSAGDCWLENEFWRLTIDAETGEWASLVDKQAGLEVLARPGNALVVMDDASDTWSHGIRGYHTAVGRFGGAAVEVVETGPLRASLVVDRGYGRSTVRERISLYAGEAAIEVSSVLDWHDTRKALKLSFPVAIGYPVCTYDTAYGVTVRVPTGAEEPGQTWVDASGVARDASGEAVRYGASLINDCKYGFDITASPGYTDARAWTDVRMTILRSPAYAFHDPRPFNPNETYAFIDQGEQEYAYWFLPHTGSWVEAGTAAAARERNAPILKLATSAYDGGLPPTWSVVESLAANVEVTALKASEDGSGIVVHLHETAGADGEAKLAFPLWGAELAVPMHHHEVKSLLLRRQEDGWSAQEVNLLEEPVAEGYQARLSVG